MSRVHYDIFLSHHSADKPAVEELARRLVKSGITPWIDSWNLIPGAPWQEAIEEALSACVTCAVFIGPSGTGPWQNEELRFAIDRRVSTSGGSFRVIPVLLPGAERGERSKLPPFLLAATWVEFRQTLDDESAFHRLICGIRGIEPGPGPTEAIYAEATPYRGLRIFDVEDWPFFFGREALVEWLLDSLRPPGGTRPENRFLGIIGPSGSGKSSLARAGLVAALKQGKIAGSQSWPIAICKPGTDPLESLAITIAKETSATRDVAVVRNLISDLREDLRTVHLTTRLALSNAPADRRLVVLMDQFEEIFTLCHDEGLRQAAIDNLLHAATIAGGQTIVLLTLRADFYGRCAAHLALAAALSDHQVLVGPMTSDELRQAIVRPAQLAGCEFEPGLIETLLGAVKGQPGGLPLLQHALLELWNRRTGRHLTHAAYKAIRGVEGALEQRAETVYNQFDADEQVICRRIFLRLTQPGEATEDTRRRAAVSEFITHADERSAVERVVAALTEARLLTMSNDVQSDEQMCDVAHEALIGGWPRLQQWIAEDRAGLLLHRRLTEAALEWQRSNYDEDALYRGARLVAALEWQKRNEEALNALERDFLQASAVLQNRERLAAQQREAALTRGLVASAIAQLSVDPELSILLAVEAVQLTHSVEAEDALREALLAFRTPVVLGGHVGNVVDAAFSPNGASLVTASWDSTAEICEVPGGRSQALLSGFSDRTNIVAFHHFSSSQIRNIQAGEGRHLGEIQGHTGPLTCVRFSPDGRFIITASRDRTAWLWDARTGQSLVRLMGHMGRVSGVAVSPNSTCVATAGWDGTARLWDARQGRCLAMLGGHGGRVSDIRFSPDGQFVITADQDGAAYLWNAHTGERLNTLSGHTELLNHVSFSPDGQLILTACQDGTARLWNIKSGYMHTELHGHAEPLTNAAWSPDGQFVATASEDHTARIWNAQTGQSLIELRGHTSPLTDVAMSPNGLFAVTASQDKTARIWNTLTGQSLTELRGHTAPINHALFSPDGQFVVTTSQDNTARLYDCDVCSSHADLLMLARSRVARELSPLERAKYLQG